MAPDFQQGVVLFPGCSLYELMFGFFCSPYNSWTPRCQEKFMEMRIFLKNEIGKLF